MAAGVLKKTGTLRAVGVRAVGQQRPDFRTDRLVDRGGGKERFPRRIRQLDRLRVQALDGRPAWGRSGTG